MVKHTQTIGRQKPTNGLSEFDHFVELALKRLREWVMSIAKRVFYENYWRIPLQKFIFSKVWDLQKSVFIIIGKFPSFIQAFPVAQIHSSLIFLF